MEREKLIDFLNKLENLEKEITEDNVGDDFINELDSLLKNLSTDIQESYPLSETSIEVKIKKLDPGAVIPSYSTDGDAGLDLTAISIDQGDPYTITYGTGISMEIPKGYVGLLFPRSSICNYDLSLANSVGVIDSGYRGEIKAIFKKEVAHPRKYELRDRVAQILIIPYPKIRFVETNELTKTDRGDGGFGHTGKQ